MKIVPTNFDDVASLDDRYRKLDTSMNDMKHMVSITTQTVWDLTEHHQYSDVPEDFRQSLDEALFLVFQMKDMFAALKAEYDGGWDSVFPKKPKKVAA
ncbi:MAG TPA: hypothetical protein VIJ35_19255 [Bradyrhizobium sp.]